MTPYNKSLTYTSVDFVGLGQFQRRRPSPPIYICQFKLDGKLGPCLDSSVPACFQCASMKPHVQVTIIEAAVNKTGAALRLDVLVPRAPSSY